MSYEKKFDEYLDAKDELADFAAENEGVIVELERLQQMVSIKENELKEAARADGKPLSKSGIRVRPQRSYRYFYDPEVLLDANKALRHASMMISGENKPLFQSVIDKSVLKAMVAADMIDPELADAAEFKELKSVSIYIEEDPEGSQPEGSQ